MGDLTNRSNVWIKVWENVWFITEAYMRMMHQSLTDDEWKTLTNLVKTWSSAALAIDHQYYEYTQAHELVVIKKQPSVSNIAAGIVVRIFGDTP